MTAAGLKKLKADGIDLGPDSHVEISSEDEVALRERFKKFSETLGNK